MVQILTLLHNIHNAKTPKIGRWRRYFIKDYEKIALGLLAGNISYKHPINLIFPKPS